MGEHKIDVEIGTRRIQELNDAVAFEYATVAISLARPSQNI